MDREGQRVVPQQGPVTLLHLVVAAAAALVPLLDDLTAAHLDAGLNEVHEDRRGAHVGVVAVEDVDDGAG